MLSAHPASLKSRPGFTLVEVIVSILVVSFMGAVGFFSYSHINNLNEDSRERDMAKHFAQRTMERIRAEAQTNFYGLTTASITATFAADPGEQAIVVNQFPGFTRSATITDQGTPELKKAQVEITWNRRRDPSKPASYQVVNLLTRPEELLPGNIHGRVTNAGSPGSPVANALVNIVNTATGTTRSIRTDGQGNYTFADVANGVFRLRPGNWNLNARCTGFKIFVLPANPVSVPSGVDVEVNFAMTPLPKGWITGSVVSGGVSLYQNGVLVGTGGNSFYFEIIFTEPDPQGFTLVTNGSYSDGYVGGFSDCEGWGKRYNYRGWSSAVVSPSDYNTFIGCNDWTNYDANIQLNPGQTINIDINLVPVPTATLKGHVYDDKGALLPKSSVDTWWHSGPGAGSAWSDDGNYSLSVPAEQELFPDSSAYYLGAQAHATNPNQCCCSQTCNTIIYSPSVSAGPLYEGDTFSQDFIITPPPATLCGNAHGTVLEVNSGALGGATVTIAGISASTNGAGIYSFDCGGTGFKIPQGTYEVSASAGGFYSYSSSGNTWYTGGPSIAIVKETDTVHPPISLLRQGTGSISGRVVEMRGGSAIPVGGATVYLDEYSDGGVDDTDSSGGDGGFSFSGVGESWPPASVIGNPLFQQGGRNHSVSVPESSQYYGGSSGGCDVDAGSNTDVGWIVVTPKSGM